MWRCGKLSNKILYTKSIQTADKKKKKKLKRQKKSDESIYSLYVCFRWKKKKKKGILRNFNLPVILVSIWYMYVWVFCIKGKYFMHI